MKSGMESKANFLTPASKSALSHGLTNGQIEQINRALAKIPHIERAVLFGSRAKGTFKAGSDIDLALIGSDTDFADLLLADNALDDLDFPYFFDLVLYEHISDIDVRTHIDRVGVTLYHRNPK